MAAHQAPLFLGLSRQEHWSGLPFPSPMHKSEKWKWSHSVMSDSSQPPGLQSTRLMGFARQKYWSGLPLPSLPEFLAFIVKDFLDGSDGKAFCLQCGRPRFDPWVGKILWRRKWQPTPVLLPGKSHGQRSMVGYSPLDHKESDTTEWLHYLL